MSLKEKVKVRNDIYSQFSNTVQACRKGRLTILHISEEERLCVLQGQPVGLDSSL